MAKYIFGLIFLGLLTLVFSLFNYLGFFKSVDLEFKQDGPFLYMYKTHVGPYHEISSHMDEVAKYLQKESISCKRSIGRFLDNPDQVEQDRLRSQVGCLLETPITNDPQSKYKLETLTKRDYLVARFDGAPSLGPLKVYPKAENLMNEKGYRMDGPIVEIYTDEGNDQVTTHFYFPVTK